MMRVSTGTIEEPERGTWVADVESRDDASGTLLLGGVTWVGRVASSARENGRTKARVVGGLGDLGAELPEKWYLGGGSGNTVVNDIARAVGMSATPELPNRVASWQRAAGSAGEGLDAICDALGAQWWVDRDGVIRAGARDSTLVSGATVVDTGTDGIITLAAESSAGVAPGRTLAAGGTVRHARHVQRPDGLRIEAATIAMRTREPAGLGYLRMHRGVVERQHDDGSLDLIVDNSHSLTRIPWLPGIPAVCTLEPGDVVMVASWAGGDPRQWAAVGVSRVEGLTAVSGKGDTVDCGALCVTVVQGVAPGSATTIGMAYVPPDPPDTFDSRLATGVSESATPLVGGETFQIRGIITSGNPRILAGSGGQG